MKMNFKGLKRTCALSLATVFLATTAFGSPTFAANDSAKSAVTTTTTAAAIAEASSGSTTSAIQVPALSQGALKEAAAAGVYYIQPLTGGASRFVNNAGGYTFVIPAGMQVTDMSHSSLVSVFEDEHRHLEVYTGYPVAGYTGYGYKFLENTQDHTNIYQSTTTIAGHTAYVKQWERRKLSKIKNDHNYYASVTIMAGAKVYDFFFTSDRPFWEIGGYLDIAKSFTSFAPTSAGYDAKSRLVASLKWNEETNKFFEQYFGKDSSLTWGMYNRFYSWKKDDLKAKEEQIGYKFPILLHYTALRPDLASYVSGVTYLLDTAYEDGRTIELTLQTPLGAGGPNRIYRILEGEFDGFLHDYAKAIAKFGHPVLFRLFNEMNGDWCDYSAYYTSRDPEMFKAAYRYIYSIFEEEGANANTIWIWNPNAGSFPNYMWNDQRCYYPGDEYVDVVGLTAYNTGTYYKGETWKSFNACYYDVYTQMAKYYTQPMMITEFSCASCGGDKVSWVKNMFYYIKAYDKIKVAVWWDGCDWDAAGNIARSYFIDDPKELLDVFSHYLVPTENETATDSAIKAGPVTLRESK